MRHSNGADVGDYELPSESESLAECSRLTMRVKDVGFHPIFDHRDFFRRDVPVFNQVVFESAGNYDDMVRSAVQEPCDPAQ